MTQRNNCLNNTAVISEIDPEDGHGLKYCLLCEFVEEFYNSTHPALPVNI